MHYQDSNGSMCGPSIPMIIISDAYGNVQCDGSNVISQPISISMAEVSCGLSGWEWLDIWSSAHMIYTDSLD